MPLYELIKAQVFAGERLHGDDTTVPVLARGKCRTGRIWTYVRDDRPFGGRAPPAAVFFYSPDRAGIHPERHLAGYGGILQADAYAGFNRLYARDRKGGPITDALPRRRVCRRDLSEYAHQIMLRDVAPAHSAFITPNYMNGVCGVLGGLVGSSMVALLRPTIHPSLCSSSRQSFCADKINSSFSAPVDSTATRRTCSPCCARAISGQVPQGHRTCDEIAPSRMNSQGFERAYRVYFAAHRLPMGGRRSRP
jgi:hypothetical protein